MVCAIFDCMENECSRNIATNIYVITESPIAGISLNIFGKHDRNVVRKGISSLGTNLR